MIGKVSTDSQSTTQPIADTESKKHIGGDWWEIIDSASGYPYYLHNSTGVSQWTWPEDLPYSAKQTNTNSNMSREELSSWGRDSRSIGHTAVTGNTQTLQNDISSLGRNQTKIMPIGNARNNNNVPETSVEAAEETYTPDTTDFIFELFSGTSGMVITCLLMFIFTSSSVALVFELRGNKCATRPSRIKHYPGGSAQAVNNISNASRTLHYPRTDTKAINNDINALNTLYYQLNSGTCNETGGRLIKNEYECDDAAVTLQISLSDHNSGVHKSCSEYFCRNSAVQNARISCSENYIGCYFRSYDSGKTKLWYGIHTDHEQKQKCGYYDGVQRTCVCAKEVGVASPEVLPKTFSNYSYGHIAMVWVVFFFFCCCLPSFNVCGHRRCCCAIVWKANSTKELRDKIQQRKEEADKAMELYGVTVYTDPKYLASWAVLLPEERPFLEKVLIDLMDAMRKLETMFGDYVFDDVYRKTTLQRAHFINRLSSISSVRTADRLSDPKFEGKREPILQLFRQILENENRAVLDAVQQISTRIYSKISGIQTEAEKKKSEEDKENAKQWAEFYEKDSQEAAKNGYNKSHYDAWLINPNAHLELLGNQVYQHVPQDFKNSERNLIYFKKLSADVQKVFRDATKLIKDDDFKMYLTDFVDHNTCRAEVPEDHRYVDDDETGESHPDINDRIYLIDIKRFSFADYLVAKGITVQSKFHKTILNLVNGLKTRGVLGLQTRPAPHKKYVRFNLKAEEYKREGVPKPCEQAIKDTVRITIECKDNSAMCAAQSSLEESPLFKSAVTKDRRSEPSCRDVLQVVWFEGLLCEVQFHFADILPLKKFSHAAYKLSRTQTRDLLPFTDLFEFPVYIGQKKTFENFYSKLDIDIWGTEQQYTIAQMNKQRGFD